VDPADATAEAMRMSADGPHFGRWNAHVDLSRNEQIEMEAARCIVDAGHIDLHHISGLINPANDLSKSTDNTLIQRVMKGEFRYTSVSKKPKGVLGARADGAAVMRYALFTYAVEGGKEHKYAVEGGKEHSVNTHTQSHDSPPISHTHIDPVYDATDASWVLHTHAERPLTYDAPITQPPHSELGKRSLVEVLTMWFS
jgi:hypothetical protein